MSDETIFEQDGPVAILTFNRPEARNAMTWEMYEALREACERVDADPGTRVLVLRGAGDRADPRPQPGADRPADEGGRGARDRPGRRGVAVRPARGARARAGPPDGR